MIYIYMIVEGVFGSTVWSSRKLLTVSFFFSLFSLSLNDVTVLLKNKNNTVHEFKRQMELRGVKQKPIPTLKTLKEQQKQKK